MQELELYIPKKLAIDQLLRTLQPLRSLKLSDSDHPEVFDVLSAIPDKVKKMKVFELDVLPSITALPTILYPEWINLTHLHLGSFWHIDKDISDFCVKMALQSKKLQCIKFPGMKKDDGLDTLLRARNSLMRKIKITSCALSENVFDCLITSCKNLEFLDFDASKVEPPSLFKLRNLQNLKHLNVWNVQMKINAQFVLQILDKLVENANELIFCKDEDSSWFVMKRGNDKVFRTFGSIDCSEILNHNRLKNMRSFRLVKAHLNDFSQLDNFEHLSVVYFNLETITLSNILVLMEMARQKKFEKIEIIIITSNRCECELSLLLEKDSSLSISVHTSVYITMLPVIFDFVKIFPLETVNIACSSTLQSEIIESMTSMPKLREVMVEVKRSTLQGINDLLRLTKSVHLKLLRMYSDSLFLMLENADVLTVHCDEDTLVLYEIFDRLQDSGIKRLHLQHDKVFDDVLAQKIGQMSRLEYLYVRDHYYKTFSHSCRDKNFWPDFMCTMYLYLYYIS